MLFDGDNTLHDLILGNIDKLVVIHCNYVVSMPHFIF